MPGSQVAIFQVITLSRRPGKWTKQETGQWVTHCSWALLTWLMWSGPYCELYCHAVCTWICFGISPLSRFVYERIRLDLINPRVLKRKRSLQEIRWTLPLLRLVTCEISDFQYKFSSMITPKKTVSFTWSIFWLLIIKIWIVWFVRFWHCLDTMNLVFFKFNESLLALNYIDNLFSPAFSRLVGQSLSL